MSRKLAVIIHRLRLGYKATWQLIEDVVKPCEYCDDNPDSPLLHYLLECPQTATLRDNRVLPDMHDPNSHPAAAKLCRELVEEIENYGRFLLDFPPPR